MIASLRSAFLLLLCAGSVAVAAPERPPLFRVSQNGRVGLVSADGQLVVPPRYEGCASQWTEGYLWVVASLADDMSGNFLDAAGHELLTTPAGHYADAVVAVAPGFWHGRAVIATPDGKLAVAFPGGWVAPGVDGRDADFFPHAQGGKVGFVDSQGHEVLPARYQNARPFHGGLAPAQIEGRWGLVDLKGDWVLPPEYDDTARGEHGFWTATRSGKIGILKPDGSWIHEPAFDEIGRRAGDVVTVRQDDHWGLVDAAKGEMTIAPAYEEIEFLGEKAAWARKDGQWGLVGYDGATLLPFEYDDIRWISPEADLWQANQDGQAGLVHATGEFLLPCAYRSFDLMTDRFIVARSEEGEGLFDAEKRRFAVPPAYDQVIYWERLSGNSAAVRVGDRWGLVGLEDGEFLLPLENDLLREWQGLVEARQGDRVALFVPDGTPILPWSAEATEIPGDPSGLTNGFGKVVCQGKAGLIDSQGAIRLPCRYQDVGIVSEGLVPAMDEGKWGFASLDGAWAIPPTYAQARSFSDGLAAVLQNGQFGYIDKSGTVQVPFAYADAGYAHNGLLPVAEEHAGKNQWGLIHTAGGVALPLAYDALEWIDVGPDPTRIHGTLNWTEF